ncbi:hypothetical protein [Pseudomonas avellanae]|uniref:hypothetical protein n=1 Tax=Pseudomonas avellanae TaxID=46257 RepID=UPI000419339C|nr:hypothetical protein [Pseudomonas avellanae]
MYRTARITLLGLVVGLSACAVQHPAPPHSQEPIPTQPGATRQGTTPAEPAKAPAAAPKTSASFAPPPGGGSRWDPRLGVYVMEGQPNTFYRQRTYYQWNNGWSWATNPNGPWQATDASGVPAGLGKQFSN